MNTYGISFVDDDALAMGHDFAFVDIPDGGWIFYRESALSPVSLEDSWTAYRALVGEQGPNPSHRAELCEAAPEPAAPRHLRAI
jgi:hypothetical protein